jgi:hypothetical protein
MEYLVIAQCETSLVINAKTKEEARETAIKMGIEDDLMTKLTERGAKILISEF